MSNNNSTMSNNNSINLEHCNFCNSCNFCNFCYSCDFCNSCNFCDFCYSCYSCNFCYSCYSCYSCDSCNSCNSCNSCYLCNFCYFSANLKMSERMLFCVGKFASKGAGYQKNNQIFNTQVTPEEWDKAKASLPNIKIGVTKWVDKKDMTDEEKKNASGWKTMGGYLKRYSYKEAWANWWAEASQKDKDATLNLPHFDKDIFKEITGIDIDI